MWERLKRYLSGLPTRTGVILIVVCLVFHIAAFAQLLLPLTTATKTTLFIVLFGFAKITQYSGIAILGVKGWQAFKAKLGINKNKQY